MASAIGNLFSNIGNAISEGFSNLTGGSGNKSNNTSSSASTNNSNNNTSKKAQNTPTPSSTSSSTPKHGSSSSSSSNTNNRSNSAGAQALTQQITSNSSTNTTTSSSKTGNSKIDSFVSTVKENVSNSSNEPKTTVTEAMRDNTSSSNNQSSSTTSQKTQNQTSSSVISSIIEDKATQTVTEAMRENTSGNSSVGVGSTSKADDVVLSGFTGVVGGTANTGSGSFAESITEIFENKELSSKPSGGITPNDINYGVVNMGGLVGVNPSVDELNRPVSQTSDVTTDTMVGLGEKPTLSLLPEDYNPLKVQSTISTLPDGSTWQIGVDDEGKATAKNMDKTVGIGADLIYRDPSLVGIHTFDSKAESEAFLKELYSDGNYNWTDTSAPWYDTQTGEFIGYLGEEAYPYAIIVPETYDAPIRLEFNTGGIKGNSPSTGTGKSSWTDVPSAKTRAELRDAGFDYGFSSRDLDYNELVTQNERRGYDESWYDGMVGQNSTPYDAEKGGYDARTSNISVADVKGGKVSYDMLSNTPGAQAILDATTRIKEPQQETNVISKWQNPNADWDFDDIFFIDDKYIDDPTAVSASGGILNDPVELIGTLLGVGALAKVGSIGGKIGGKIGGSMIDDWVSVGGKTMSGSNIIDSGVSSMVGGSSVRNLVKPVSEFVSTNNQMKLAEIGGLGIGSVGLFAGKELELPSNVFEIIPQNIFSTEEVEPSSTISGLNEIISSPDYQSELEVPKEFSDSIEGFRTGSVFEIERVKEKEKEKEKTKQKDEGFSYADVPSYTIEDKIKYAQEALKKQLEQEREYEKQKAEEAAKQKEQDRLIEKDSELIFIPTEITKVNEKNKNKVIENNENVIFNYPMKEKTKNELVHFNYPMKEKTKNELVHDIVLTRDGLVKNKGLTPFIGGFDGSSSNIFIDDTPFISEVKDTIGGIGMGIPKPSPKKDDDDDDYRMGELTGASIFGRRIGRSWKVYNEDISDANQFTGLF